MDQVVGRTTVLWYGSFICRCLGKSGNLSMWHARLYAALVFGK
jgi:hypothetical protein